MTEKKLEWIEIIEPITKNIMFANLKTGECVWELDDTENVLSINEQAISSGTIQHQWWQLFDIKSSRFFYYNDRTQETTWQKPKDKNVIILPLSKLQLGQTGELRTKTVDSPSKSDKSNKIKLTSTGEVILKRDCATQTNLTNVVCFNASTQTNLDGEDENKEPNSLFSFSSYIDQFEQMTNRSTRSNLSNKSSSNSTNCFDTNCKKSNCSSLKHYLMNEAKFAGVYDDRQYWKHQNNSEISDEDELENRKRFHNKNDQHNLYSGDSSTDQDDEDSDFYLNRSQESLENEEEDFDEETNDEQYLSNDLEFSDSDDLADYFKNNDNLNLETKVRLQQMINSQLERKKNKLKGNKCNDSDEEDEYLEDESEVIDGLNVFKNNKIKRDPNDYFETSSFIFLNKAATFDSNDDLDDKPIPLKRHSSRQRLVGSELSEFQPNQMIANVENPEIVDPSRNLRDKIVDVGDLLKKELPSKPNKKEVKKKEKNIPKPPKRKNSLDATIKNKTKEKTKNEELEKFAKENIKRHLKKGGLNQVFKRKESLKGMLVWTKQSIKQPMIATLLNDNELKQEAIYCFKLIQQYCGDREFKASELSRASTLNDNMNSLTNSLTSSLNNDNLLNADGFQNKEIAFRLIECAITRGSHMKDEIYIQLCRQTTDNPNEHSLQAGITLMTICLYYFSASNKFSPYLFKFLNNHKSEFARNVCMRKFKKRIDLSINGSTSTSYCKRPVDSKEIQMVHEAINKRLPGIFGESLEQLMEIQSKRWPDRQLPWILVTLSETILRLGGNEQEGIFRIPGDVEEMSFIKLHLDCLDYEKYADNCDFIDIMNSWRYCATNRDEIVPIDVHSIAGLLKQWFRELPTPLLPYELYDKALEYCDTAQRATEIIEHRLPKLNKLVFGYLIRFLQVFCAKQNVELTKMDESNIAMVYAPNLIRQQKTNQPTDPSVIFDNTRREMSFIRTLIQSLDTSFIQGII